MKTIMCAVDLLLIVLLLLIIKSTDASISCLSCWIDPYDNITNDLTQYMTNCKRENVDQCFGTLSVSYADKRQQIQSYFAGFPDQPLDLGDPEDRLLEDLSISFKEFYVTRTITVFCSESSNCSIDHLQLFHEKIRSFVPMSIWKPLSNLLYSSSSVAADLVCLDPSGDSVPCPNGVCLVRSSTNVDKIDSSCFQAKSGRTPYALNLCQYPSPPSKIRFSCNKPLCNSKETTQQVFEILASANIILKSDIITT